MFSLSGELNRLKGRVNVRGSIAYVPQQAWMQNATVESNILFGQSMDVKRYNDIIDACALRSDISILPGGDQTEIGEKGINLSGGQKQRVSVWLELTCFYTNILLFRCSVIHCIWPASNCWCT